MLDLLNYIHLGDMLGDFELCSEKNFRHYRRLCLHPNVVHH